MSSAKTERGLKTIKRKKKNVFHNPEEGEKKEKSRDLGQQQRICLSIKIDFCRTWVGTC